MNPDFPGGLYASAMQSSMLLPCFYVSESQPYVQQFRWTFFEDVQEDIFKKAWKRVLKRHDTFFHSFSVGKGDGLKIKRTKQLQVAFSFENWSHWPPAKRRKALSTLLKEDLKKGFNPRDGVLCRMQLVRQNSKCSELIWTSHHALFDGRGRLELIREFIEVYESLKTGKAIRLKKSPAYADYLKWYQDQNWKPSKAYFKKQLKDLEESTPLNFGLDFRRAHRSGNHHLQFLKLVNRRVSRKLKTWAKKNQTSLNILAQAAWGMFLHLSTSRDTVIFGAPRACRKSNLAGADSTVGLFVNTLPVIVKINPDETVAAYLQRIKDQWRSLRDHENTPLSIIQKASKLPKNKPLFESLIGFESYQLNPLLGDTGKQRYHFHLTGYTDVPFSLQLRDGDRLQLEVSCDSQRFSRKSIDQTLNIFIHLLEQLTVTKKPLTSLELLTPAEKIRLKKLGTGPKPKLPEEGVHRVFEKQAAASPNRAALRFKARSTNYRSLNQRANRLARLLRHKGIKPGACVGILLERSERPLIAQLAILKAGAFYQPLDPEFPEGRLKTMIADARPKLILTETKLRSKLSNSEVRTLDLDRIARSLQTFSARNLASHVRPADPAYVMYTSGSTGTPKGVVVPHRAIVRLVRKPNYVNLSAQTRCLQMATTSFDASTFEIWAPLLNGGCCVICPDRVPSLLDLESCLKAERINTLWLTASLFNFIIDSSPEILAGVKQLLTGGEALSPSHIRNAQKALPHTRLINGYGPTENTTFSCCYPISKGQSAKLPIPIGLPISHSSAFVLNKELKRLPPGSAGELYVGGSGVALGYLNNPQLTRERFIPNPFSHHPGALLYKTGDRVFQREDGCFEYLERFDDQVKIRGFRIEPLEIQNCLLRIPGIRECAVLVRNNLRSEPELAAFIVLSKSSSLNENQLRKLLADSLPDYMIPNNIEWLSSLPLTKQGKVDRDTLLKTSGQLQPEKHVQQKKLNQTEKNLWQSWKKVLGQEPAGLEENFFNAGGHSLVATHFLYRVQSHFKVHIPIHEFYRNASIRKLASFIKDLKRSSGARQITPFAIRHSRTNELEPLSIPWNTIYKQDITHPESTPTNHVVRGFEMEGSLKPSILLKAIEIALNNHERYRTYAVEIDGEYFEKLLPHVTPKVERNDFSKLSDRVAKKKLQEIYDRMCGEWVSLREAPMLRVSLSKISAKRYFLCTSMNHSICDGNSLGAFFGEVSQAYNDLIHKRPVSIPKPSFSYREYEKSLIQWLKSGNEKRIKSFWSKQLQGTVPIDYPFLKKQLPDGIQWNEFDHCKIHDKWRHRIMQFTSEHQISIHHFFITVIKWMNARYTGQLDSYVSSSVNVRSDETEERIGGDIVSVLLLRSQLRKDRSFLDQVKVEQATLYEAMDHRRIGVTTVAKPFRKGGVNIHKVAGQCRVNYAPNLESKFALQGISTKAWLRPRVPASMRFGFVTREQEDKLLIAFQHSPEIFIKHGLDRLKINFHKFVEIILAQPEITLEELPDLSKPSAFKKPVSRAEKRKSFLIPIKYMTYPAPKKTQQNGVSEPVQRPHSKCKASPLAKDGSCKTLPPSERTKV